jgi:hypothetical protein
MSHQYSYQDCLAASQRVNWQVEDLIGEDKPLDFSKPFLPESLARVEPLGFLSDEERLTLNQIRGHGYLYTFGLVEEFIEPFVVEHAKRRAEDDDYRVRAFLQFASEEAKHIHLFKRFREAFVKGFGSTCEVIGPPHAIAAAVLGHHPLSVALVTLHIEWMTQRHYVDSVKDDKDLDPQFKSLLKHHWMEEAQHAKLDTLMIEDLATGYGAEEIAEAIEGYVAIGGFLDGGLAQQVAFDLEALTRATGRAFTEAERDEFTAVQRQALRWTFLGSGMTHKNFLTTIESLRPGTRAEVEEMAPTFS